MIYDRKTGRVSDRSGEVGISNTIDGTDVYFRFKNAETLNNFLGSLARVFSKKGKPHDRRSADRRGQSKEVKNK